MMICFRWTNPRMDPVRTRDCQSTFRPLRTSETYTEQLQPQVLGWMVDLTNGNSGSEEAIRIVGAGLQRALMQAKGPGRCRQEKVAVLRGGGRDRRSMMFTSQVGDQIRQEDTRTATAFALEPKNKRRRQLSHLQCSS
jgi:hypothetical protein